MRSWLRQHRDVHVDELREEVNVQVALHIEQEVTLLVRMLDEIREKLDVESRMDRESVEEAKGKLHPRRLMEQLRRHLEEVEGESLENRRS